MESESGFSDFSAFIERYIDTVEGSNQHLEALARLRADIILAGFHRSLEKSYHKSKFIEAFLADICQLNDDYEAKGFKMAVNGFDTAFRSVLFLEMMRELELTGLGDQGINIALSMNIVAQGHDNARAIVHGYATCIAVHEIREATKELGIAFNEPEIKTKQPENLGKEVSTSEESAEDDANKSTHKQQVLLLERLGFFELPTVQALNAQNKGKLLSHLLNRSEKNSTEYVRNLAVPKSRVSKDANFVKTEQNVRRIDEVIEMLQAKNFVVTTPPTTPD